MMIMMIIMMMTGLEQSLLFLGPPSLVVQGSMPLEVVAVAAMMMMMMMIMMMMMMMMMIMIMVMPGPEQSLLFLGPPSLVVKGPMPLEVVAVAATGGDPCTDVMEGAFQQVRRWGDDDDDDGDGDGDDDDDHHDDHDDDDGHDHDDDGHDHDHDDDDHVDDGGVVGVGVMMMIMTVRRRRRTTMTMISADPPTARWRVGMLLSRPVPGAGGRDL
jgi:hypothetical protein